MIKKPHLIIVVILIIFHIAGNFFWLRLNQEPPFDDDARHLLNGLICMDILRHPSINAFKDLTGQFDRDYPPVFPMTAATMSIFFGRTSIALKMSNAIFWIILLFSLYYLARKISGENAALFSVFLTSMYPAVFGFSRTHLLEFSLVAMVTLNLCLLLYTEDFKSIIYSILFGISLGLGMLTKVTFFIFILGPLSYIVLRLLRHCPISEKPKAIRNLWLSLLLGFGLAGFWYLPRIFNLSLWRDYFIYGGFVRGKYFSTPNVLSFESVSYYLSRLYADQILPAFTLIFFLALLIAVIRKKSWIMFLLLWIIVPYLGLTLIITKTVRYTAAFLPAVGLICSIGIYQIKNRNLRMAVISLIVVFDIFQYVLLSYTGAAKQISVDSPIGNKKILLWHRPLTYTLAPRRGNWHFEEISSLILKESSGKKQSIGVIYTRREEVKPENYHDNWIATNRLGWLYFIKLKELPVSTYLLETLHPEDRQKSLTLPDFIIGCDNLSDYSYLAAIKKDRYKLLNAFLMPDGSHVRLYKFLN